MFLVPFCCDVESSTLLSLYLVDGGEVGATGFKTGVYVVHFTLNDVIHQFLRFHETLFSPRFFFNSPFLSDSCLVAFCELDTSVQMFASFVAFLLTQIEIKGSSLLLHETLFVQL